MLRIVRVEIPLSGFVVVVIVGLGVTLVVNEGGVFTGVVAASGVELVAAVFAWFY